MWRNLCLTRACKERQHEAEMTALELERQKLGLWQDIATQPAAEPNKALIIIPIAILVFGAITAFVLIRKKKK